MTGTKWPLILFFFFSSRRRHTRLQGDWSSDVCSSDLILVSVGGWVRGTQAVSAAVMQNYDERAAKVLRQPALVNFIQSQMNDISPEARDEPLIKEVSGQLPGI